MKRVLPDLFLLLSAFVVFILCIAAYRAPDLFLLVALATSAVHLASLFVGPNGDIENVQLAGIDVGVLQKIPFLVALVVFALHRGIRASINWPILAVLIMLAQSLALAEPPRGLTVVQMLRTGVTFILPWVALNLLFDRRTRNRLAWLVAILPAFSVALGVAMDLGAGRLPSIPSRISGSSIAAAMSYMAFAGFAVALHESHRTGKVAFTYLASLNVALLIMAGGRMGILASMVFFGCYAFMMPALRQRLGRHGVAFAIGGLSVAIILAAYLPFLQQRMFGLPDVEVLTSRRDAVWSFLFKEFLVSPVFGRGLGSGAIATLNSDLPRGAHNEYLRLLVEGGVVGFLLYFGAVALAIRQLLKSCRSYNAPFVIALMCALAIYAMTDNVLTASELVPLYIYLASLRLTRHPSGVPPTVDAPGRGDRGWHRRSRSRSTVVGS